MSWRLSLVSVLITALFAGLAGTAHAANFTLTSKNRHFCCTTPNAFLIGQPAHPPKTNTMGSVTGNGYQPAVGPNPVTVGTGPTPSIKIGKSEVVDFYSMFSWVKGGMTDPGPGFKYNKGTASFMNEAGTLKKGGGWGSFSFCPKAIGPGPGACTNPGKATPISFNGRINVKQGPNKFGGTLHVLGGTKSKIWRWLGPNSAYPAAIVTVHVPTNHGGMTPGKVVVATDFKTKVVTHLPGSTQTVLAYDTDAVLSNHGAGPWTTGTVYLGVTMNGSPLVRTVSIAGYDKRTAMGAGNIQLVSGNLFNLYKGAKNGSFPIGVRIRLPEPAPSLGFAACALGLALIGLIGTRRRRASRGE